MPSPSIRICSLLATAALGASACALPPPLDGRSAYAADAEPLASAWLRSATRVPAKAFMLIEGVGKLPTRVRGDSAYWSDRFLAPGARPLEQASAGVLVSIFARDDHSPDLLRYQYRVDKLELTVIESASFTLVRVDGTGLGATPAAARSAIIDRTADAVLNLKGAGHDWRFAPLEHAGDNARFSTASELDPGKMRSWEERADGGIDRGGLYFFLYKKNPERFGYDNPRSWFDDDFRKIFRTW